MRLKEGLRVSSESSNTSFLFQSSPLCGEGVGDVTTVWVLKPLFYPGTPYTGSEGPWSFLVRTQVVYERPDTAGHVPVQSREKDSRFPTR